MNKTSIVHFAGKTWMRIEPPWIKGPRPTVTYKEIG